MKEFSLNSEGLEIWQDIYGPRLPDQIEGRAWRRISVQGWCLGRSNWVFSNSLPGFSWRGKEGSTPWPKLLRTVKWLDAAVASVHWTTSAKPFPDFTGLLPTWAAATSMSCQLQQVPCYHRLRSLLLNAWLCLDLSHLVQWQINDRSIQI